MALMQGTAIKSWQLAEPCVLVELQILLMKFILTMMMTFLLHNLLILADHLFLMNFSIIGLMINFLHMFSSSLLRPSSVNQ